MSETTIQQEIERLTTAKTNIISSITSKGGTVPPGSKLDDLPEAIDEIPSGSGATDYGYGYITYYPEVVTFSSSYQSGCTIDVTDDSKFYAYLNGKLRSSYTNPSGSFSKDGGKYATVVNDKSYDIEAEIWDPYTFNAFAAAHGFDVAFQSQTQVTFQYDPYSQIYTYSDWQHPEYNVTIPADELYTTTGIEATSIPTEDVTTYIVIVQNNFFTYSWYYPGESETNYLKIKIKEFEDLGIDITLEDEDYYASFTFEPSYSQAGQTTTYSLINENDFNVLTGTTTGDRLSFTTGVAIRKAAITEYTFSSSANIVSIGNNFMTGFTSLVSLNNFPSTVTTIGNDFLSRCGAFNQELNLDNVVTIGDRFKSSTSLDGITYLYNKPISLPKCTSIGANFLSRMANFNSSVYIPLITTIPNSFLSSCSSFNQAVDLSNVTSVGSAFLAYCTSFNQQLDTSGISSAGNQFLAGCSKFNQEIDTNNFTSIGTDFLSGCTLFNQPLDLSNVESISSNFLSNCTNFNQPLDLSKVESIGTNFLSNCTSFSQDIVAESVSTLGSSFLNGIGANFNGSIALPSITSVGDNFLKGFTKLNSALDFGGVTSVGQYFMQGCTAFNSTIDIHSLETVGQYFMSGCTLFNEDIDLENLTTVGNYFLYNNTSFNKPLSLDSLTTIGTYFMSNCSSFNQSINLSGITYMSSYFMNGCKAFNQDITISANGKFGTYFMYQCDNFTSTIYITSTSSYATGNYSLSTNTSSAPLYTTGATVSVPSSRVSKWTEELYKRTSSPYRNVTVVATAEE